MNKGDKVEIIDTDFVQSNQENIGVIVKSGWVILPFDIYKFHKIHVYEVELVNSKRTVFFPIESLIVL